MPVYRTILQKCQSTAHAFLQSTLLWLVTLTNSNLSQRVGKLSLHSLCSVKQDGSATCLQQAFTRSPAPAGRKQTSQKCHLHFLLC